MAIRVTCSSCGRNGRIPDHAIGRIVQCPGCGVRRRLTVANVVLENPDDLEVLDDPPVRPVARARSAHSRPAPPTPAAVNPQRRSVSPAPVSGIVPPTALQPTLNPVVVGLGVGAGVLSLAILLVLLSNRGSEPKPDQVAAADRINPPTPPGRPSLSPIEVSPPSPPSRVISNVPALSPRPSRAGDESVVSKEPIDLAPETESDEPGFATDARKALAAAARRPDASRAVDSPTENPPGVVLSTAEIVARYEPSVALIEGKVGSGTGFLVAPGILATNSHVIDGEFIGNLEVRFPSADEARKGPVPAELLYEDAKRDLAFLAVETDLPALRVAQSYRYRKGEDVTVIGNPGLDGETVLENAISRGVMSTKAQIDGQSFYQLGIAVNPGNSGGPVFDSAGQVIGVVTLRIPGKEELSFCIPVEELRSGMGQLQAQSPPLADAVRSRHRTLTVFKNLSRAGALFGVALELQAALRSNPADRDLQEKARSLEDALPILEQSLMLNLVDEARGARNDLLLPQPARRKLGELADSYNRLRETHGQARTRATVAKIRTLKSTHRKLVEEVGSELKIQVPKELLAALDDHLVTGLVTDGESSAPSAGSAQQRLWDRYGLAPPSFGRTPGMGIAPPHGLTPPGFGRPPGMGIGPRPGFPGRLGPRGHFGQ